MSTSTNITFKQVNDEMLDVVMTTACKESFLSLQNFPV